MLDDNYYEEWGFINYIGVFDLTDSYSISRGNIMAPKPYQIAGMVLEEAILALIGSAGFSAVTKIDNDATIDPSKPPITIHGRGTDHQIDVVADPIIGYPFSNPTRLLIEAKAYSVSRPVKLPIIRNAVGTLKDISEFWRPRIQGVRGIPRYHYRYCIFASSEFSKGAQEYAYAQDISLVPLRRSAFFTPVINEIDHLRDYFEIRERWQPRNLSLTEYRTKVRNALNGSIRISDRDELYGLVEAVRRVKAGLIAVANRQFPIFLVPKNPHVIDQLRDIETIRIFWDRKGWYVRHQNNDEDLFSFDLPDDLFALYATDGNLSREQALYLKVEQLQTIHAFLKIDERIRVIQFNLDMNWLSQFFEYYFNRPER